MSLAYKIVAEAEWRAAKAGGVYAGSAVDREDGYIHMSTADQLGETVRSHYAGRADLLLLTVDLEGLGESVRWEPSRGGALFPHLYGDLPPAVVRAEQAFSVTASGDMVFADGAPSWP